MLLCIIKENTRLYVTTILCRETFDSASLLELGPTTSHFLLLGILCHRSTSHSNLRKPLIIFHQPPNSSSPIQRMNRQACATPRSTLRIGPYRYGRHLVPDGTCTGSHTSSRYPDSESELSQRVTRTPIPRWRPNSSANLKRKRERWILRIIPLRLAQVRLRSPGLLEQQETIS
jgi:hypothetical protein